MAEFCSGREPVKVPHGLIHDWIGAVFISGTTVKDALALVQDYDEHKHIYRPEVIDSRLIAHAETISGPACGFSKGKIITVLFETEHDVHYRCLDRKRWICRSKTTRIAEMEDPESAREHVLRPEAGYGFL